MTDRERAIEFLRETYRRRVERVETHAWGELVVTPGLPRVYDANFAVVERWGGDAAGLQREMDRVQNEHGFAHRKVVIPDETLAARLWPALERLDWPLRHRYLVMAQTRPPDRPADTSIEVLAVGDVYWRRGRQAQIELEGHSSDPEVTRQLLDLDRRLAEAMDFRHLASFVDGGIASYAGLYLDGTVGQIEDWPKELYRRLGFDAIGVEHVVARPAEHDS